MPESSDAMRVGGAIEPLSLPQRKARGYCTCPLRMPDGSIHDLDADPCQIHAQHTAHSAEYNRLQGLLFFDDSRNRYVTWEDAVEGMRQPRYAGASTKGLVLFTWMNLMRLLEALCHPDRDADADLSEHTAEELTKWAGQNLAPDVRRSLMVLARGGQTEALCKMFRTLARRTQRESGAATATL